MMRVTLGTNDKRIGSRILPMILLFFEAVSAALEVKTAVVDLSLLIFFLLFFLLSIFLFLKKILLSLG